MKKLFGTDGIRGIAGIELTPLLAFNVGKIYGNLIKNDSFTKPKIVIGKDTRISSGMVESALTAGFCAAGVDVVLIGVVPTPAVSFTILRENLAGGIMVSASHNLYAYNGIKIFGSSGMKLKNSEEDEIERLLVRNDFTDVYNENVGRVYYDSLAKIKYIKNLKNLLDINLSKRKIVIDCSNGSASKTAESIFRDTDAKFIFINKHPNGVNINYQCGSTNLENLKRFVIQNECDLGIAFDGDADRCLAVSKNGEFIDGDQILIVLAKYFKANNLLKNNTVVVSSMSNLGFIKALEELAINAVVTDVGDRYILEELLMNDYNLGAETSGHVICLDYAKTGDGQLTACLLLKAILAQNIAFNSLDRLFLKYPQVLINVKVNNKYDVLKSEEVNNLINKYKRLLNNNGRIFVRASGTEPLVRVMVEGKFESEVNSIANNITHLIKERFGEN